MQNVEAHPQAKLRHSQKEAVVQSGKNEKASSVEFLCFMIVAEPGK
jgi:hypothetical protein